MSGCILGIDPGWNGGAASVFLANGHPERVYSFSGKTESDIILSLNEMMGQASVCYIERVHSMPKQGVASSFKFGWIYGLLRGLTLTRLRTLEVTPQAWQKALGCLTKGDKNVSKSAAQRLFPSVTVSHATADALLIAYYGYTKERGDKPMESK